jgi:hypothetical protein
MRGHVSTAVFRKGKVLQVHLLGPDRVPIPSGRLQEYNSVSNWIQSVMDIYNCRLFLKAESWDYYYDDSDTLVGPEFRAVTIDPAAASPASSAQQHQNPLERMAELLTQKKAITNELNTLVAQMSAA